MAHARATVQVDEHSTLREHVIVVGSRGPCGWLDVGEDGALIVCGSPAALRRLAAAVLAAADAADELPDERVEADARAAA
jgi:hypothetical protein